MKSLFLLLPMLLLSNAAFAAPIETSLSVNYLRQMREMDHLTGEKRPISDEQLAKRLIKDGNACLTRLSRQLKELEQSEHLAAEATGFATRRGGVSLRMDFQVKIEGTHRRWMWQTGYAWLRTTASIRIVHANGQMQYMGEISPGKSDRTVENHDYETWSPGDEAYSSLEQNGGCQVDVAKLLEGLRE